MPVRSAMAGPLPSQSSRRRQVPPGPVVRCLKLEGLAGRGHPDPVVARTGRSRPSTDSLTPPVTRLRLVHDATTSSRAYGALDQAAVVPRRSYYSSLLRVAGADRLHRSADGQAPDCSPTAITDALHRLARCGGGLGDASSDRRRGRTASPPGYSRAWAGRPHRRPRGRSGPDRSSVRGTASRSCAGPRRPRRRAHQPADRVVSSDSTSRRRRRAPRPAFDDAALESLPDDISSPRVQVARRFRWRRTPPWPRSVIDDAVRGRARPTYEVRFPAPSVCATRRSLSSDSRRRATLALRRVLCREHLPDPAAEASWSSRRPRRRSDASHDAAERVVLEALGSASSCSRGTQVHRVVAQSDDCLRRSVLARRAAVSSFAFSSGQTRRPHRSSPRPCLPAAPSCPT